MMDSIKEKLCSLRAKYEKAANARSSFQNELDRRHPPSGSGWSRHSAYLNLSSKDRKKLSSLIQKEDKAGDRVLDFIRDISPRDWAHGVPRHWVITELTYEDACRPLTEKLSVVPPLAYGQTEHKT